MQTRTHGNESNQPTKKPDIDLTNPPRTDTREAEMGPKTNGNAAKPSEAGRETEKDGSCGCPTSGAQTAGSRKADAVREGATNPVGLPVEPKTVDRGIDAAVTHGVSDAAANSTN